MIDIGDAVLTFLGDTTQLDAAYQRVGVEGAAKMAPAAAAVEQVGAGFAATGVAAAATGAAAVEAGGAIEEGMGRGRSATYEAKGEAALLGEMFGIHLPRHVRTFVAELPGVGTALQAAFAATAIIFIIEALAKGVEKLIEWSEAGKRVQEAMDAWDKSQGKVLENLETGVLKAEERIAELTGNHLEALRLKLLLINDASLSKLIGDVDKLTEEALKAKSAFDQLSHNSLLTALGMEGSEEAKAKLIEIQKQLDQTLSAKTPEAYNVALQQLDKSFDEVGRKIDEIKQKQEDFKKLSGDAAIAKQGFAPDPNSLKAWEELRHVVQSFTKDVLDSQLANADERTAAKLQDDKRAADEAKKAADEEARALAKRDKEVIDSVNERVKEEQRLYKKETDDSLAEVERELKGRKEAAKQWVSDVVASDREELKEVESKAKLATATVTEGFSEQEKAVQKLGQFRLMSQGQVSKALELLYLDEKNKILKILNDLLLAQQNEVKKAQSQLTAAKSNPFISPEQIRQLEAMLHQAELAVDQTHTKIAKTTQDFDNKQLAAAKGYYGQALALAVASGNQLLAEKLRENHAALLSAQAQLVEAKARGANTTAIQHEIDALKKLEKELGNEAHGVKGLDSAMGTLKDTMKDAYTQEVQAFSTAMEAMISGQMSFGEAMEASTLKMIASMAQKWAEYFMALAAGSWPNFAAMAKYTAAAVAMEVIAGALSGAAGTIGQSSGSGTSTSPGMTTGNVATQTATNPAQSVNVPHLASGGLITGPTLAMLGESSSREAVIPLNDGSAMKQIADAIDRHMSANGGGGVNFYFNKGVISSDTVGKMAKKLTRQVQTGRVRLTASNTHKITRRA